MNAQHNPHIIVIDDLEQVYEAAARLLERHHQLTNDQAETVEGIATIMDRLVEKIAPQRQHPAGLKFYSRCAHTYGKVLADIEKQL